MGKPAGNVPVDWISVEGSYRAGVKSLRSIAKTYGITEGAIRARGKKEGWTQDATGTKRALVNDRLAGITQGITQCVKQVIEDAASEDVEDMNLALRGARALLRSAASQAEGQGMEPKDLKILSECIKLNVDTIRRIRGLDAPGATGAKLEELLGGSK